MEKILVCKTRQLKCDDLRLKLIVNNIYSVGSSFAKEDANHFILHCSYVNDIRRELFNDMARMIGISGNNVMDRSDDIFYTLLGKLCKYVPDKMNMWDKVARLGV